MTRHGPNRTVRRMSADPIPAMLATLPRRGRLPAPEGRRRLALIVDDEPAVGALLAMALDSRGWATVVATAGAHAADIARDLEVDLLVTDFQMPGMSGFDLASSLRSNRAGLPVVLVSGSPDAARLALPQPFAFLPKPFSLTSLFGTIGALVPAEPPEA